MINYFILMVSNIIIITVISTFALLLYGCGCKDDIYGKYLVLEIPINTSPTQDTFEIGDTLWIEANISKDVKVRDNQAESIFLEDFNFYSFFSISEISDTFERFNINIDVFSTFGNIDKLELPTAISYPIEYIEFEDYYYFKGGVALLEPGLFTAVFYTESNLFKYIDHPAVYVCKNTRRNKIDVYYKNSSTNLEAFENIFLMTKVDYLKENYTFEGYKDIGSHTFIVKVP